MEESTWKEAPKNVRNGQECEASSESGARQSHRAPALPDPPLASRPPGVRALSGPSPRRTRGASPEAPAPSSGNARDADRAELVFPLCCVKTCQILVAGSA
ncbi:uncharacterized protein V5649_003712 [Rhynchonycteris naso]